MNSKYPVMSSAANSVKRNLSTFLDSSTPVRLIKSRKRKSYTSNVVVYKERTKMSEILEEGNPYIPPTSYNPNFESYRSPNTTDYSSIFNDSIDKYHSICSQSNLTLNDCSQNQSHEFSFNIDSMMISSPVFKIQEDLKLSHSLERCRLDFDNSLKRTKVDYETPCVGRKSNSAPGSPQHSGSDTEYQMKKSPSLDFTPTKCHSIRKISTPESSKILYAQLVERKPSSKPKSPQKLRAELKRINKPAKKRLFPNLTTTRLDFVRLFTVTRNNFDLIEKIFGFLKDSDLANVSKVSTLWRKALLQDKISYDRYKRHSNQMICSKENLRSDWNESSWNGNHSLMNQSSSKNTPSVGIKCIGNLSNHLITGEKENCNTSTGLVYSPSRSNWHKFTKLAQNISREQKLEKCPSCGDPSVLEMNIAQCTKHNCQYIWCIRCMSGSKQGPDHFLCNCEKGTTPPRTDKNNLGDISNIDCSKNCSFLYYNTSYEPNTTSGYFSDVEKSVLNSSKSMNNSKIVKQAFSASNRVIVSEKTIYESETKLSHFHNVAQKCMGQKSYKTNTEPSSPPKITKTVVGSQKSKKNLRRLCF